MTLEKFLTTVSLLLGFFGSIFVLKGVFAMSPSVIGEISMQRWDFSIPTLQNLAAQKGDAVTGVALIILAFIFQIVSEILPSSPIPFLALSKSLLVAILLSVMLSITALLIGRAYETHTKIEVGKAIVKKFISDESSDIDNFVKPESVKYVEDYTRLLIDLKRNPNESDIEFLKRVGKEVGYSLDDRLKPPKEPTK